MRSAFWKINEFNAILKTELKNNVLAQPTRCRCTYHRMKSPLHNTFEWSVVDHFYCCQNYITNVELGGTIKSVTALSAKHHHNGSCTEKKAPQINCNVISGIKSNRWSRATSAALQKSHVNGFAREFSNANEIFQVTFQKTKNTQIRKLQFQSISGAAIWSNVKVFKFNGILSFVPFNSSSRWLYNPIEIAPIFHFWCCCWLADASMKTSRKLPLAIH